MPVPFSLIPTLVSAPKGPSLPIIDSFEVWPNGTTDAAPDGWTLEKGGVESARSTLYVTDGSYSWTLKSGSSDAAAYQVLDFTNINQLRYDAELQAGTSYGFTSFAIWIGDPGVSYDILSGGAYYSNSTEGSYQDEVVYFSSITGEKRITLVATGSPFPAADIWLDNFRFEE